MLPFVEEFVRRERDHFALVGGAARLCPVRPHQDKASDQHHAGSCQRDPGNSPGRGGADFVEQLVDSVPVRYPVDDGPDGNRLQGGAEISGKKPEADPDKHKAEPGHVAPIGKTESRCSHCNGKGHDNPPAGTPVHPPEREAALVPLAIGGQDPPLLPGQLHFFPLSAGPWRAVFARPTASSAQPRQVPADHEDGRVHQQMTQPRRVHRAVPLVQPRPDKAAHRDAQ